MMNNSSRKPGFRPAGWLAALALCGALGLGVAAADPGDHPGRGPARGHGAAQKATFTVETRFMIAGTVESVNYATNTVRVVSPSGRVAIVVTPTTSIARRGVIGGISDIRRGAKVNVSGISRQGSLTAQSIFIR